ncbi:hypothetical protein JTB14_019020 [Gonioctena quinquepunctata]|nr:hypothetical protein JTB14_019020 [Gonioctena quinquepunctata]
MDSFYKRKKISPQNIVIRLNNRQVYAYKRPGTHFYSARQFYQNVFPNFTVINIEKPPCFLRKFSPDGKYFIAFSADQTSLEIYLYRGPAAAADLLRQLEDKNDERNHFEVKSKMFDRFFAPKFRVNVAKGTEQLNRECSLFTDDGRYVIIGSASFIPEEIRPHFYEIITNNESVTPNLQSPLEDYTPAFDRLALGQALVLEPSRWTKYFCRQSRVVFVTKTLWLYCQCSTK